MSLRIVVVACLWMISLSGRFVDCDIGINWGRQSVTTLVPSMVVDLLLQNGIKQVKLFSSDTTVINAFSGTDIAITVTVANPKALRDRQSVMEWVSRILDPYHDRVNFKYVCLGNNAFAMAKYVGTSIDEIVARITLVQGVFDELGHGNIKVVISHSFNEVIKKNITMPSEAEFAPHVLGPMAELIYFMKLHGVPFIYDYFPITMLQVLNLEHDFAFSDDKSKFFIKDDRNGIHYTNLFDFIHDSFVWALRKVGAPYMKLVVGQTGWPTDGIKGADAQSAERYWKALLPKVASKRGTPARPGVPIDIFVHALSDETNNLAQFPFSRHWGIYRANGMPKYKIDLSGQGRDVFPTVARGVNLMPTRWCAFNKNMTDPKKVRQQFEFACSKADCTPLAPGGSCGMLSYMENVTFAFNAYFQSRFQAEKACLFEDLGQVVTENPSRDGCTFSIEVVRGHQPLVALK